MTKPAQPLPVNPDAKTYQGVPAEGVIVRCRQCLRIVPGGDAVDLRAVLPEGDDGMRWACKPCAIAAGIGAD